MKREATFLIAVALLVNSTPMAWGQDEELNDQDLQTLLDDKKSTDSESKEVLEPSAATSEVTPAAEPVAEEGNEVQDLAPVEPVEPGRGAIHRWQKRSVYGGWDCWKNRSLREACPRRQERPTMEAVAISSCSKAMETAPDML